MHENSTLPSIGKFKFCDCANPESGFMENRLKYSITPHTANDWKFYLCAFDRYLFVLGRCACFDMSPACLHANQNKTFNNSILQLPEGLSTIILCAIYILLGVHLYNVDVMEQHAMGCVSDIETPGLARNHQTFINFFSRFRCCLVLLLCVHGTKVPLSVMDPTMMYAFRICTCRIVTHRQTQTTKPSAFLHTNWHQHQHTAIFKMAFA